MKTIFTLLVALGLVTAAQAQDRRDSRQRDVQVTIQTDSRNANSWYTNDFYNHDVRFIKSNPAMERKMARKINAINREYDQKIQRVQRNLFMNRFEKQRQIRSLEQERQFEIRMTYAKFRQDKYGRNGRW
jgi:hypothetical protein